MKLRGFISAVLCGAFVMGVFSGCGDNIDREQYVARTREDATAASEAEAARNNSQAAGQNTASVNWADMNFSLNGTELKFDKLPYSTFTSMGWSYDPMIYGLDVVTFETGVVYDRSVYLNHESYDDTTVKVGFTNFDAAPCNYEANHVWSIEFSAVGAERYPDVKLSNITWGSSEADIKAVFGEPTTVLSAEDGSTEISYGDGGLNVIRFYVYEDTGVGRIIMESFD